MELRLSKSDCGVNGDTFPQAFDCIGVRRIRRTLKLPSLSRSVSTAQRRERAQCRVPSCDPAKDFWLSTTRHSPADLGELFLEKRPTPESSGDKYP
ncbi:unnamed protein product, partial [Iphiclides podalirius]